MQIEYGAINAEIDRWNWPSKDIFNNWKADFLALEESRYFDVYLLGGFLEQLHGKKSSTPDVDIILTGCDRLDKIEKLIVDGTRLGIEKYHVFFDVLWFDELWVYADDSTARRVKTYIASNQWVINGEVRKTYANARRVSNSLWEMDRTFPTRKQRKLLDQGYVYCRPLLISAKANSQGGAG
jgi:hypothetical protein